ncbi:MAG: bifunctional nuclease family protein [Candidatus Tectomicrobia bacterium]|nr:bifunctional nuclease family protein [Candidatus Tectomicrobia bacterium]
MKVKGLTVDPVTKMPIVILKDLKDERALPIWIGPNEANAIVLEMEHIVPPRPMTHDLIKNILDGIRARVDRVVVNDLKESTFYATIFLNLNGVEIPIDSRPSDAIAVALRVKAPIYVSNKVMETAKSIDLIEESVKTEQSRKEEKDEEDEEDVDVKRWLENLRPEDFSKDQT